MANTTGGGGGGVLLVVGAGGGGVVLLETGCLMTAMGAAVELGHTGANRGDLPPNLRLVCDTAGVLVCDTAGVPKC